MTKTDTQNKLDDFIPGDVISTRSQAGKELSYLETWYIIDRLNQVIGQGNWNYATLKLDRVYEGTVEQSSGTTYTTSYVATVGLQAVIDGRVANFSDVGYGDGTDKRNPGKAHELATKEAVSDGLKRCVKNLGRSMGLALYDKNKTYVTEKTPVKISSPAKPTETPIFTPSKVNNQEVIKAAFKVLELQKKITKEEFKTKYLGGKGLSTIPFTELSGIYENMKKDFPHLNGSK
jgi:DNA repair and recombination protein RAD52